MARVKRSVHAKKHHKAILEQAKGMVSEREGLKMEQAFTMLRNHARNHNLRLMDVARDVIDGSLAASSLDRPGAVRPT